MKEKVFWACVAVLVLCCVASIGFAVKAHAADATLHWQAVDRATGYKIYKSEDMTVTWDGGMDVGNVTSYNYQGLRDDCLIHFRFAAYNAGGETIRLWSGAWCDFRLYPVDDPGRGGIE